MQEIIEIEDFIKKAEWYPVIDARSETEYHQGHFPGAINIPLLNNEERTIVGTVYKKEGKEKAVLKGFDLVGGKFGDYIRQAREICPPAPQMGELQSIK